MSGTCKIILIQPPFVQLNSPYSAPYYLKRFLESEGHDVTVLDHSIGLFERIFSRPGLEQIFQDASEAAKANDGSVQASYIEEFLSEREIWLALIDRLIAFLRGRDTELAHFLALANGCFPGGPRTDAFLAERGGDLSPDEAKLLATMLLSDLADFITCTLDSGFALVRYNQKDNRGGSTDGYIMNNFYRPMLNEEWKKLEGDPVLLGFTIPFPGCLVPAMVCAESAKKHFGSGVKTVAGGGYVNTELRFLNTPDFFDYFDYLSFDRGYGSAVSILKHLENERKNGSAAGEVIYKTMYRFKGSVIAPPDLNDRVTANSAADFESLSSLEDAAARTVFPDYSSVDFSRYLYPVDDTNPMHRLWSDGHWLKAYLAYGCYWHSCAFCDVTLDYIRNFIPVDPASLFAHLKTQAEKTGIRGIHFCDEAAPVSSLLEFAILNREAALPLSFWGNIRFEKNFDSGTAAILAAGGLMGVSAGLEVATERGLKRLAKGIDLENAVRVCAAFKEAGILTHAYLIYGYWDEDEQELVDSAEILRQLFEQGLLDSAFWHKFILTRHSRIYAEKQRGLHPGLKVEGDADPHGAGIFSLNDLSFEGEEKFDKYTDGLDRLLRSWMAGDTGVPVAEAFPFRVKAPSVPPDLITALLDSYARDRNRGRSALSGTEETMAANTNEKKVLFLGSIPRLLQKGGKIILYWRWQLADREIKANARGEAEKLAALLKTASRCRGIAAKKFYSSLEEISGEVSAKKIWKQLLQKGLAIYTIAP